MEPKRPFASRAGWLALWLAWAAVMLCLVPVVTKPWRASMPDAYGLTLVTLASLGVFLCLVVSVVCGVLALFGIRKHGRKGILAPALAGLVIATLMLIPVLLGMASGFAEAAGSSPVKARAGTTNHTTTTRPGR
jgi:hypothetical protein